ncbi:accessory Sec system protein translocase subunit SecY2 [Lactococcus allomyrinae]|uniref:Accessory Sec system protein translocase subunit SecY2 n=1 Tax=Lactococcus allomyrinae TaxID=2419773 RepID=A0A387BFL4_9LACT|nr:accessory Sec system protein translocase subunit SecY2 [Lactococcus allomyrinae]AYG00922.1 accessory Sec system protein translocase subunit SecY2 [Lactococcus allomyrinae]
MKEYYGAIKRCLWTFLFIIVVQFGGKLQLPLTMSTNIESAGIMRIFANMTAGNATKLTLFSLGLGPYMIALILWSTLTMLDIDVIKNLSAKQAGFIQRVLTFMFCILQSFTIIAHFKESIIYSDVAMLSKNEVHLALMIILIAGGMIVSYIADMNMKKGIGKQMVIILPGLLANIPAMLFSGQTADGLFTTPLGLGILALVTIAFLYISVFLYRGEYRIKIQQTGMDVTFENSYIPIKVLAAGALPFMFGVTLFSIPQLLTMIPSLKGSAFLYIITQMFSYTSLLGIITYGVILTILGYGFSHVNIRVHDIAKSLRDSGDYILGVIPGEETEKYLRRRLNIMIIMGNIYMLIVSLVPLIIGLKISDVSNLAFYFGSIFMVIIIVDNLHEDIRFMLAKGHYKLF